MAHDLVIEPLTAEAFAAYGDVIETNGNPFATINDGLARRYYDLSAIDAGHRQPHCSMMVTKKRDVSEPLSLMERHAYSTQAFIPLFGETFIVVVSGPDLSSNSLRAFATNGRQGVNYRRNAWHHPMIAVTDAEFLVLDAGGAELQTEAHAIRDWNMRLIWNGDRQVKRLGRG